jgi:hypothetical protein
VIVPLPASVLRADLTQLVASRLGLGENLVNELLATAKRRAPVAAEPGGGAHELAESGTWVPRRDSGWTPRSVRFRAGGPRAGGRCDGRRSRGF